jgi:hypothetical protein
MEESFATLAKSLASDAEAAPTLRALRTIAKNIYERPLDEKVRTLRLSNESVQRKLLAYPVASQFLQLLGFVEAGGYLSLVSAEAGLTAKEALAALDASSYAPSSSDRPERASSSSPLPSASSGTIGVAQRLRSPPPNYQKLVAPMAMWHDVCGLPNVKRQLCVNMAGPPLGEAVLLYGPACSGKALVAHAAAHAWGLTRVLTAWGSEVQTPFAVGGRQRASGVARLALHATDVSAHGPCVVLLRGMDCVLPAVVRELRQALGPDACRRIVVVGTCTATDALVVTDRTATGLATAAPVLSAGRLRPQSRSISGGVIKGSTKGISSAGGSGSGLSMDELACFEHLVHVPAHVRQMHAATTHSARPADTPAQLNARQENRDPTTPACGLP